MYDGTQNYWFGYNDGTVEGGTMTKKTDVGGCDDPMNCAFHAASPAGAGYTGYGAGVGFTLANNATFDATQFGGIDVWMRGTTIGTRGPGFMPEDNTVHVKFITQTPDGADPRLGDDFGAYCPLTVADDGGAACYKRCHLPWSGLKRDGFKTVEAGAPDPGTDVFDPANLVKIQFEFSSYTAADSSVSAEPVMFDVWIDAVSFLPPTDM
jgi:hypothetical protein